MGTLFSRLFFVGVCCSLLTFGLGCGGSKTAADGGVDAGTSTFGVGGTVSGLAGMLILQNNGGDELIVTEDGPFGFSTELADGADYDVSIDTKPGVQECVVSNGQGSVQGQDVASVTIQCEHYVFFAGSDDADTDVELWRTDGTEPGTIKLRNIRAVGSSSPEQFTAVGDGTVIFSAFTDNGREPWITNGTEGGTVELKDIHDAGDSTPQNFFAWDGITFFDAFRPAEDRELWKTDGTEAGTQLVEDVRTGPFPGNPSPMTELNGELYLSITDQDSDRRLQKTDGETVDAVGDFVTLNTDEVDTPFKHDGKLFFAANTDDLAAGKVGLYTSDGTAEGTSLIKSIGAHPFPGNVRGFTAVGSMLFFLANDEEPFTSVWITDGTGPGTVKVVAASILAEPLELSAFDGALFFTFAGEPGDVELWRTDGTPEGTSEFIDIETLPLTGSNPNGLTVVGDLLFFAADDGDNGEELWVTDGTTEGTQMVLDINPSGDSDPHPVGEFFGKFVFTARTNSEGYELWITDGTAAGTTRSKDVCPGSCSGFRGF